MLNLKPLSATRSIQSNIMSSAPKITIATRESRLALWQAEHIRDRLLGLYPQASIQLLGMTTTGDQILDRTLAAVGGKGLFVKELETALEERRADIAVHSLKDVPMNLPTPFAMSIVGEREDPRDAFISNQYSDLGSLPAGAVVGTSSLRRECQLRARFPGLVIKALRGNLDTRLRKLDQGEYQAIILAAAGLRRLGLENRIRSLISLEDSIPAVGQGALGIEYRTDDGAIARLLAPLTNPHTEACVWAERALSRRLAGSCDVPLGAHATAQGDILNLTAFVGSPNGQSLIRAKASGPIASPEPLGEALAQQLLAQGAKAILDACRSTT
jgi:hydroxymethylbilane synthase